MGTLTRGKVSAFQSYDPSLLSSSESLCAFQESNYFSSVSKSGLSNPDRDKSSILKHPSSMAAARSLPPSLQPRELPALRTPRPFLRPAEAGPGASSLQARLNSTGLACARCVVLDEFTPPVVQHPRPPRRFFSLHRACGSTISGMAFLMVLRARL